jgi:acetolactate synthase-1/2/3 large subunit
MELETALREQVPLVCIVSVDGGWGMERSAHRFKGVETELHHGTDIAAEVRYDLMAEALGCHGEYVDAVEDLAPALQRCVEAGRPAVVHAVVDKELNVNAIGYEQFQYSRTL